MKHHSRPRKHHSAPELREELAQLQTLIEMTGIRVEAEGVLLQGGLQAVGSRVGVHKLKYQGKINLSVCRLGVKMGIARYSSYIIYKLLYIVYMSTHRLLSKTVPTPTGVTFLQHFSTC